MTELEKCLAGEHYNCHDKIFLGFKSHARTLLQKYNALAYEETELKSSILKELFGGIGTKVSVASPFICDYGCNIYIGNNVSINMNCTFVDCNRIIIGDDVLTDCSKCATLYGNTSNRVYGKICKKSGNRTITPTYLRITYKNRKWLLAGWRRYCSPRCDNR